MRIEFIGGTGTGKTTLVRRCMERLRDRGFPARSSHSLLARRTGTGWILNLRIRHLVQSLLLLPYLIDSVQARGDLWRFAWRLLRRPGGSVYRRLSRIRSFARIMAGHEILRRASGVLLIDEGPIGLAHNLFAGTGGGSDEEIESFADLVSKPDRIVYVSADVETVLERTRTRDLAPLLLADASEIARFVEEALRVFDRLSRTAPIRERCVRIRTGEEGDGLDRILKGL